MTQHTPPTEPTIGRLIADISRDISELAQAQLKLAKTELRFSALQAVFAVIAFAATLLFLAMVVILGSIAAAYFISMTGLHLAWSFLIVTGVYLLAAIGLALFGWTRIKRVRLPEKTIEAVSELPAAFSHSHPAPAEEPTAPPRR